MKAARLHEYDEHIGTEPLTLEEIEEPKIEGPLDVIVRIGGAGLCRTDLHIIEGQWAPLVDPDGTLLPYIQGHENAGWVHELGSAVSNVEVGDAVIVHPHITCGLCRACRNGDDMHCVNPLFPGLDSDGGFAELLKTNARAVVKLPEGVEPQDVAAHADAGLTAYHAVRKAVPRLHPGTRAVVIGAGGLGHIGIQSLKAITAAEIIVVDRSEEALEVAVRLGADETVVADGSHVDKVLEMTDGHGAEVVLDFVGEMGAEKDGWNMTARAGSHFIIGYGGTIEIPTIDIISTERNVIGNLVGTYNDLAELMTLQAQGKVSLQTHTYSLDAVNDAVNDLNQGRIPGGRGIFIPEGATA
jgi:NAD+-dependent secondary alcohol dehydrogenase Adh1